MIADLQPWRGRRPSRGAICCKWGGVGSRPSNNLWGGGGGKGAVKTGPWGGRW